MPTELYAVAGSTIEIGGTTVSTKAANFVSGDFSSQTWTAIDGWETMGALGDSAETISTSLINRNRVIKQKGVSDAGSMECTFAIIRGNAGQAAVIAAQDSQENYAFRITYPDGSKEIFIALVMSNRNPGGGANDVLKLNVTLEINSNIVFVAAT